MAEEVAELAATLPDPTALEEALSLLSFIEEEVTDEKATAVTRLLGEALRKVRGGGEGAAAVADGADGGGVSVVEGELAARRVHLEDVAVEDGRALDLELEPRVEREPRVLRAFGVEHHLVRARGARAVLRAQLQELAALDVHQLDRLAVVDRRA